jgi:hypothetical protein
VIELPRLETSAVDEVVIEAGEPLCRLVPVQRADFVASEMDNETFGELYDKGQAWLAEHGKEPRGDDLDITGQYARQQDAATFAVEPIEGDDDESPQ